MDAMQALEYVKNTLGTCRKCADFLGYTETHINAFLRGRKKIPKRTASYIIFKAEQLKKEQSANG